MTQYTINYLTGDTDTVEADGVEYDVDARDYTFTGAGGKGVVALAPVATVRSVIRTDAAVTD
jgi:5-keto 4-deoxyuronate isomerase